MSEINNNSESKQWFHVSILNYLYKTLITQYKYRDFNLRKIMPFIQFLQFFQYETSYELRKYGEIKINYNKGVLSLKIK